MSTTTLATGTSVLTIVVEDIIHTLPRETLFEETISPIGSPLSEEEVVLPGWVTVKVYKLLEGYLLTKSLSEFKDKESGIIIQLLRLSDHLMLLRFQQSLIVEVVVPSLKESNCLAYLEETYKKLKNLENGSQHWYTLLNASINFFSFHIYSIYREESDKVRKLPQKILNEVLDRAIKLVRRDQRQEAAVLFDLIMQSKKIRSVDVLCAQMRQALENKKINLKIHAKLSWKLVDIPTIDEKHTKNFKFLDIEWYLQAKRNGNAMHVQLNLCPDPNRDPDVGVFYVKLVWVDGVDRYEEKTHVYFLRMHCKEQMPVIIMDKDFQQKVGRRKIELSIFCSIDQIYTFVINYIAINLDRLTIEDKRLRPDELLVLIELSKDYKLYGQACRLTKTLINLINLQGEVPQSVLNGYPAGSLSMYDLDYIKGKLAKLQQPELDMPKNVFSKTFGEFDKPVQTIQLRVDLSAQRNRNSQEKHLSSLQNRRPNEVSYSTEKRPKQLPTERPVAFEYKKSEERPESRGRLRKIFANSPSHIEDRESLREQIAQVTNLRNYLRDPRRLI